MKDFELKEILSKIGKVSLGPLPTPIQEMPNVAKSLGVDKVYVKRDDLTGLGPGGNKSRNLEYILKNAMDEGADVIIASGPRQSNLCAITACACAKLGLECKLVLNGPADSGLKGNLLLEHLCGADVEFMGPVDFHIRNDRMEEVKRELEKQGRKPFVVRNGASTGYGALGYVEAVLELKEQSDKMGGALKTIFVPAGNGGVAAGTVYGNWMLGKPFEIVVVSTEYSMEELPGEMMKVIHEAEKITGVKFDTNLLDECIMTDKYYGGGWSINTPESEKAVYELAKMEGIFLENVYTSKNFVGFCDMIKNGDVSADGAVFLHTGGFGSLFAQY